MSIYNWAIIAWTITFFILSNKLYGERSNPCNLMNIIWCICSTFSTFGWFDLYIPSEKTFKLILIYLLVFSMICSFCHLILNMRIHNSSRSSFPNVDINCTLLYRTYFIMCILIIPILIKGLPLAIGSGLKSLHNSFLLGASGYMGFVGFYCYAYIIRPFISAFSVVAAYSVGIESKESKKMIFLSLVGGLIHYIVAGGRKEIFNLIIFITIVMMIRGKRSIPIWLKKKKLYIDTASVVWKVMIIGIFIIAALAIMTMYRLHFGLGVLGTFWMYFVGPMDYLDVIINNPGKFGLSGDSFLYGKATWGFFTGPIETFLRIFLRQDYQGADYLMGMYTEKYYMISPKARINATTTIIYPFLKDYGDIGIIVGTLQFAVIISLIYFIGKNGKSKNMWMCILIYMFFTILFSVWRYTLVYYDGYMTLIWLVLLFKMRIVTNQNSEMKHVRE